MLLSEAFRDNLVLFLLVSSLALLVLFVYVLAQRAFVEVRDRHRRQLTALYRPHVDAILTAATPADAAGPLARLRTVPPRHLPLVGELLVSPLRVASGSTVLAAHAAGVSLGLVSRWRDQLAARAWWMRADAIRALGLIRERDAVPGIVALLEDEHPDVRAAAVDALGRIGDLSAVPALLGRLGDASRHQRARVVEALRAFGPPVTPALLGYARTHPDDLVMVADVIGFTGASGAVDDLLAWSAHPNEAVRAAALNALGSVGVDERGFYYALRALGDDSAPVRAMAARALGRSRRGDAAAYLGSRLDDEWIVAAHAATGLRLLGDEGRRELASQRDSPGQAGVLARQMLWERPAS
jgi:hypothetical protein